MHCFELLLLLLICLLACMCFTIVMLLWALHIFYSYIWMKRGMRLTTMNGGHTSIWPRSSHDRCLQYKPPTNAPVQAFQTCGVLLKLPHSTINGSALFTFGAVVMNFHFQTLVELKGGVPVVVLYREPDVGKTTIGNVAMSTLGIEACRLRGLHQEYFITLH